MSEDLVSGKKADYTIGSLNRMLCNYGEILAAESEPVIIYRWDMELAVECLTEEERRIAFTMMAFGDSAIKCGAVGGIEWHKVLVHLYSILNKQGLVPRDDKVLRKLQTDKSRPWTPGQIDRGEDRVYE